MQSSPSFITKTGDVHARSTLLIEAAHSYRLPARLARHKLPAVDVVPEAVREIAWKAQTRLCQRYRHMMAERPLQRQISRAMALAVALLRLSAASQPTHIRLGPGVQASALHGVVPQPFGNILAFTRTNR
jgi:hypothetical protein